MFKFGQVTLLPKKPGISSDDMSTYRPTTNLNTLGQILEHLAKSDVIGSTENIALMLC